MTPYEIDRSALPPELGAIVTPLAPDPELEALIAHAPRHGALRERARKILRRAMSDFDADGWLGTHRMALLGPSHWAELARGGRLLDVGAGSGAVTEHARGVFREIVTTETSAPMARRLRARGFVCHRVDLSLAPLPDARAFDVVSLLNVLDRCDRPRSLLRGALRSLAENGSMILSVPLPVRAHVDRGTYTADPDEPIGGRGETFERALVDLIERTIVPSGLAPLRLARAPYVSVGREVHVLDAAILVCARAPDRA